MFLPSRDSDGFGYLWVTLEVTDGDGLVDTFVAHLTPYMDGYGLPRIRVDGPITLGSPLDVAERETVSFYAPFQPFNAQAVTFTKTGALGTDRSALDTESPSVTLATPLGVSVSCQGGQQVRASLQSRTASVAGTLRPL
jgi:hypothetical protein